MIFLDNSSARNMPIPWISWDFGIFGSVTDTVGTPLWGTSSYCLKMPLGPTMMILFVIPAGIVVVRVSV